jgi:hypothetical protein
MQPWFGFWIFCGCVANAGLPSQNEIAASARKEVAIEAPDVGHMQTQQMRPIPCETMEASGTEGVSVPVSR